LGLSFRIQINAHQRKPCHRGRPRRLLWSVCTHQSIILIVVSSERLTAVWVITWNCCRFVCRQCPCLSTKWTRQAYSEREKLSGCTCVWEREEKKMRMCVYNVAQSTIPVDARRCCTTGPQWQGSQNMLDINWDGILFNEKLPHAYLVSLSGLRWYDYHLPRQYAKLLWLRIVCDCESLQTWRSWHMIMSGDMIPNHVIPLYTVKLSIVLGDDMCQGKLPKIYNHVVGFFEEHMSGTTNTILCCLKIVSYINILPTYIGYLK